MENVSQRRLALAVLTVSLVIQSAVLAPFAFAFAADSHTMSQEHCPNPAPEPDEHCPCCPDGMTSATGCLQVCATPAATGNEPLPVVLADGVTQVSFVDLPHLTQVYSPPDPPPIG